MSDELKPCPWCGGEAEIVVGTDSGTSEDYWLARCVEKTCEVSPRIASYDCAEDAIRIWNTRPVEDALLEKLQQLQAKWDAIPRDAISCCASDSFTQHAPARNAATVRKWLDANAPEAQA